MKIIYHHRTQAKGAEGVHINEIANALRDIGHSVNVISLLKGNVAKEDGGTSVTNSRNKKILVKVLKYISKYTHEAIFEFLEIIYNFVSLPVLLLKVLKFKPDFIYERYSLFMFSGVLTAKLFRIPIILEINDSAIVLRVRPLYFKKIAIYFEGRIFKQCSGLVFISNEFLMIARTEYHSGIAKSIVLPNAANPDFFNPCNFDSNDLRKKYKLTNNVVCGYVGAFHKWHGIDWFVKLIAPKIDGNLVLLLIGDGPCLEDIENYIKTHKLEDKIILTGRVTHEKVVELISLMNFSILPDSNMYGSPMKIFEFMAMGVPVIAPNYPPINEVIEDNESGWLFDYNNRIEAVNRTLEIARDIELCKKIGTNAREYILTKRTWHNNANNIINLYDKVKLCD